MSEPSPASAAFPLYSEITVRFRDMDALGHVNNAVYFTYMEVARTDYLHDLLPRREPLDLPIILGDIYCRFISPAHFGETLRVGVGISRFGNKSFDFVYQIDGGDGRLVARGHSTMVMYDYDKQQTIPVPPDFREKVLAFQGDWQPPSFD